MKLQIHDGCGGSTPQIGVAEADCVMIEKNTLGENRILALRPPL